MRTIHPIAATRCDLSFRPCRHNLLKRLIRIRHNRFIRIYHPESASRDIVSYKIHCKLKSITSAHRRNLIDAILELFPGNRPVINPQKRAYSQHATSATVKVRLPVERHLLHAFIFDPASEMPGTELAVSGINDHLSTTGDHIPADIIQVWTRHIARAANYNIICRIHTVAACAVRTEKIIPSVAPDDGCCLAVYGDVYGLIPLDARSGQRIKFDDAYETEICTVCTPEASRNRIHEQTGIDCIAILVNLRRRYLYRFGEPEIRRIRVQCPVPHGKDASCMTTAQSSTCRTVCHQITVSYLHGIRSRTAARTLRTRIPVPAVLGYEAAATGSESIILAATLHDCRRVMDPRLAALRRRSHRHKRQYCR